VIRLAALPWDSPSADADYLQKEISRCLDAVDQREWSMSDMEGGIHRLRRTALWVEGLGGFIQLDSSHHPIPEYASLSADPGAAKEYKLQWPDAPTRERSPVKLSLSAYLGLLRAVEIFGTIKDEHGAADAFARAFRAADLSAPAPEKTSEELSALAGALYDELRRTRLLKTLSQAFSPTMPTG
jgi:hypothetical protein